MPEPRGWEKYLDLYLAEAEEELRRIAPHGSPRLRPEEGNILIFGRVPAALFFSERSPLPEAKRWFPTLKELARLLVENLVLSSACDGYPGERVLARLLSRGGVRGLLIKGRGLEPPAGALKLSGDEYLLPDGVTDGRGFVRELWRGRRAFRAVPVKLAAMDDLETARRKLELARLFGLTYLSPRAEKDLAPFLADLSRIKRFLRRGGPLALLRLREPPRGLRGLCLGDFFLFRYGAFARRILGRGGGLCGGLYSGEPKGPPLAMAYAACEHARRAGGGLVSFDLFTYHVLGDLYADWGDLGAALAAYERAREGTRQPADLLNSLALVCRSLGFPDRAEEVLREALRLSPDDPLIHYNLGEVLSERGERKEALTLLRRAWELSGRRSLFAEALARELLLSGRIEEAREVLSGRSGLSLSGKTLYGEVLYRSGDFQEAFAVLREVARSREAPARALAYLSLLYRHYKGEPEAAEVLAREALRRGGREIAELFREVEERWN